MSNTSKKYYCDCKAMCKGQQKEVLHTTFFGHKKYCKYCNPVVQFTPSFQAFLQGLGPLGTGTDLETLLASNACRHGKPSAVGSSRKHLHLPENDATPLVKYYHACTKFAGLTSIGTCRSSYSSDTRFPWWE